jgi:hypothetical protein
VLVSLGSPFACAAREILTFCLNRATFRETLGQHASSVKARPPESNRAPAGIIPASKNEQLQNYYKAFRALMLLSIQAAMGGETEPE